MDISQFRNQANNRLAENRKFYNRLKKKPPENLDSHFSTIHYEVFERINCLRCANCCKTTSPILYQHDIERASRFLKIRPSQFIELYLKKDEDGDMVFKSVPCPFLEMDNTCRIYENRPRACKEYPHTDRKKMFQILDLTLRNTLVCPAVLEITDILKVRLK